MAAALAMLKTPVPVSCQLTGNGRKDRSCEKAAVALVACRIAFQHLGISKTAAR